MSIGGGLLAKADAKEATITARVLRADGTIEDLGVVSYWHKNPFKRFLGNLEIATREWFKWLHASKMPV
jgi:hypothetical protein